MDTATDRAAAATKHGVKAGAVHVRQAVESIDGWMRDNMKVKAALQKHLPNPQVMRNNMPCLQHIS
jgi:hypothetical protein